MKWSDFLQVSAGKDNPFKEQIQPLIDDARKDVIGTNSDFIQGNASVAYNRYKKANNINVADNQRRRNYLKLQQKKKNEI